MCIRDSSDTFYNDIPDPLGGPSLRIAARYWDDLAQSGDILVRHELRRVDGVSCAPLFHALYGGNIAMASPTATVFSSYSFAGGNPNQVVSGTSPVYFSASDYGPHQSCAAGGRGAWFFRVGCGSNPLLSNFYGFGNHGPAVGPIVFTSPDLNGTDTATACSGVPVEVPPGAPSNQSWWAENVKEYYFR